MEGILLKYHDIFLQLSPHLSTSRIEGQLDILETFTKSEEMTHFYLIFMHIWGLSFREKILFRVNGYALVS